MLQEDIVLVFIFGCVRLSSCILIIICFDIRCYETIYLTAKQYLFSDFYISANSTNSVARFISTSLVKMQLTYSFTLEVMTSNAFLGVLLNIQFFSYFIIQCRE